MTESPGLSLSSSQAISTGVDVLDAMGDRTFVVTVTASPSPSPHRLLRKWAKMVVLKLGPQTSVDYAFSKKKKILKAMPSYCQSVAEFNKSLYLA